MAPQEVDPEGPEDSGDASETENVSSLNVTEDSGAQVENNSGSLSFLSEVDPMSPTARSLESPKLRSPGEIGHPRVEGGGSLCDISLGELRLFQRSDSSRKERHVQTNIHI